MKIKNHIVFAVLFFVLFACNPSKNKIDDDTYLSYLKKGDEITNLAQAILLGNVGNAIQKGGPEYAVEYCNIRATPLVDSLGNLNNCIVSRVSDKNRNSENNLKSEQERELWKKMQMKLSVDTLIQEDQSLVYYKSIKIALPACLNCHGNPEREIQPAALEKIRLLYPNDLAIGYKTGDFRGLWKVEFKTN